METIDSTWNRSLIRPLLIASMVTALLAGLVAAAKVLAPEWDARWTAPLLLLVSLEAVYTTTWLAHPARRQRRSTWFRVAELIVWCVAIRLLLWQLRGSWPDLADVRRWIASPSAFFDAEFAVGCGLAVIGWAVAGSFGADLQRLALQPDELTDPRPGWGADDWRAPLSYVTSRGAVLGRYARRWMAGGLLLVLCAAATQIVYQPGGGLRSFGVLHVGLPAGVVAGLVVYFLSGLVLLSLGRLAVLRAEWHIQHIEAEPAITRRWPRQGLLLLLLVGALAALMPLGSTWRLGGWLRVAAVFVMRAAVTIAGYLVALLTTLLRWVTQALGLDSGQPPQLQPAAAQPSLPPEPAAPTATHLPGWLGSLAFWLPLVVIVAYALVTFLRQRGVRLDRERLRGLWLAISDRWRRWRRSFRAAARSLSRVVLRRRALQPTSASPAKRASALLRWRGLSSRQRILMLYLFTLRRSAEHGVRRASHQTPLEFEPVLGRSWPEAHQDVQTLTQAFVEARYDRRAMSAEEVAAARQAWKNVRSALRRGRMPPAAESRPSKSDAA